MPQPLHSASLAPAGQYASLLDDVRVEALLGGTIAREIRKLGNLGRVLRDHRRRHWMIDLGRKLRRRYLYTWNGEPFRRKAEAEAVLLQIRKNVAEGLDLEVAVAMILGEGAQENSVGSRIERWLAVKRQECKAGDISPTYLKELERWLAPGGYVGQWWSDKPITAINLTNIRDWATWLNRQETPRRGQDEPLPLSGKTRFNVHAAMHAFVAWLAEEDRRVRLPARWPWPSKGEPSILIISIETQDAILDAIPEEERGIFLSMAYLGIRPGEAVVLDVSDYRDGWLTISKARKGERLT